MDVTHNTKEVLDLTTRGCGVHADADALVYRTPSIHTAVPGTLWQGKIGRANALVRLPSEQHWNGKLLIGATPATRNEYSLDLLLSDIALYRGYAYAACDKATPGLTLRDLSRTMEEWEQVHVDLVDFATRLTKEKYQSSPTHTYISGLSNGGFVTRFMLERHHDLFDGGVEWEGVLWRADHRHLLTTLPIYVANYPIYRNWRGDWTQWERTTAYEKLLDAGLHPASEFQWHRYFLTYWVVSLWLYGIQMDPDWEPFQRPWSNEWLSHPESLADYPWQDRLDQLTAHIAPIQNTGKIGKPLLSVAGNEDCLIPYRYHAEAYAQLVKNAGAGSIHRSYEIANGNHVDGLLRIEKGGQQPVQPFYEAALQHLEKWVENGIDPPQSQCYQSIHEFAPDFQLFSIGNRDVLDSVQKKLFYL